MKRQYSLSIKGNNKLWEISVFIEPETAKQWQDDGIDICPVYKTIEVTDEHIENVRRNIKPKGTIQ